MRAAAIDIGTNTVLLLVADVEGGMITELLNEQRIPRLGKGVDASGNLSMDRMLAVVEVLVEYRDMIARHGQMEVVVTATSAVRDAANRIEFLWLVEEATGYRIRILTGEEEADLSFQGALALLEEAPVGEWCVIDIGGGSTELILANGRSRVRAHSFDVGSVRHSERHGLVPPVSRDLVDGVRMDLARRFNAAGFGGTGRVAVGVAGTASVVKTVNPDLAKASLERMMAQWSRLTTNELLSLHPEVLRGRQDVILAGVVILVAAMDAIGASELEVSAGGIRHGALLTLAALNEEGR